jgi:hypothetical protein
MSPHLDVKAGITVISRAFSVRGRRSLVAVTSAVAGFAVLAGMATPARAGPPHKARAPAANTARQISTAPNRPLPSPLYGNTVDDVSGITSTVAGEQNLPEAPTTRLYFDVGEPASTYTSAVNALRPVSYIMGELLDSADETSISTAAYNTRVNSYLAAFGSKVDLWEIGNEVNGNWTGSYPTVSAKLTEAYNDVSAAGKLSALTLYYNNGCGDGSSELSPLAFSSKYVPASVRDGLKYVLLSYYESDCNGIRPSAATWTAYFQQLHALYPNAKLGFGEIGLNNAVQSKTLASAQSMVSYYYGLSINLPYYVGGYFWWYFKEDALPYTSKPLWTSLAHGYTGEAANLSHSSG